MQTTKQVNRYYLIVFLYFLGASNLLAPLLYGMLPSLTAAMILLQFVIFLPLLFFYFYRFPSSVKDTLSLRPIRIMDLLLCLGITLFALPFVSLIVYLTSFIQPNLAEASMEAMQDGNFFWVLFLIAVQPAVFEELMFRGVAFRAYGHLGEKKAILLSAFLFALLHMNIQQGLYAFALGVLFAFFVGRTGSILASVLPHFFINASNWAAMYLSAPETETTVEYTVGQQLLGIGMQCLIALPFLLLLLWLFRKRNPQSLYAVQPAEEGEKERIFTPAMWIIIAIFVVVSALAIIAR